MIRRPTWFLVSVLVILVALTWYLQKSKSSQTADEKPTETVQLLLNVQENTITGLTIERASDGKVVMINRDDQGLWKVVQPAGGETDVSQAEMAVSQLTSLTSQLSIGTVQDLSVFGLAKFAYEITITTNAGEKQVLHVGDLTPTGSGYYVSVNENNPVVVSKYSLDTLLNLVDSPPFVPTPTAESTPTSESMESTPSAGTTPASTSIPAATAAP